MQGLELITCAGARPPPPAAVPLPAGPSSPRLGDKGLPLVTSLLGGGHCPDSPGPPEPGPARSRTRVCPLYLNHEGGMGQHPPNLSAFGTHPECCTNTDSWSLSQTQQIGPCGVGVQESACPIILQETPTTRLIRDVPERSPPWGGRVRGEQSRWRSPLPSQGSGRTVDLWVLLSGSGRSKNIH